MRNTALIVVAVALLAGGLLLVQGSGGEGGATDTGTTTAQETAPPAASTPSAAEPEPAPEIPTVVFADGRPRGGVKRLSFDKGDRVRFRVRSDVADEIHVHGFDEYADVAAGRSVTLSFDARFDGAYEVEMHESGTQVATLEIQP